MGPKLNPQQQQALDDEIALLLFIVLPVIASAFVLTVLFLRTMHRALRRVRPANREMQPSSVWLMLVPYWNLVWYHVMAGRIPRSLEREFEDRGLATAGEGFGRTAGQTWAVTSLFEIFLLVADAVLDAGWARALTVLNSGIHLGAFFVFWAQIAGYSRILRSFPNGIEAADWDGEIEGEESPIESRSPKGEIDDDLAKRARG